MPALSFEYVPDYLRRLWRKSRDLVIPIGVIVLLLLVNEMLVRVVDYRDYADKMKKLRILIPIIGTTLILGRRYERYSGLIALIAVIVLGLFFTPRHLKTGERVFMMGKTQFAVLFENAEYGILAAGMTLVILTGGIDLSVGSVLGMVATTFSLLVIGFGMSPLIAFFLCLCMGAAAGGVNGLLVSRFRIQPFAATLALMAAARGMAKLVSGQIKVMPGALPWYKIQDESPAFFVTLTKSIPLFRFSWVMGTGILMILMALVVVRCIRRRGNRYVAGFLCGFLAMLAFLSWYVRLDVLIALEPVTMIFLVAIVVMWIIVRYTRFGRHLYAIGGNEEAARLSGIRVNWNKFMAYVFCGLLAGLAGICNAARQELGDPEAGVGYELDAIAAVVIGGTSLAGGRGGMMLTLMGALIIGYINKILSINGVEEAWRLMAKGGIIILAVMIQKRSRS